MPRRNANDGDGGISFEKLMEQEITRSGVTTPAMELIDTYRQKLDALGDLFQQHHQGIGGVEPSSLLSASKELDTMQQTFRLKYSLDAIPSERSALADLIAETVTLLKSSEAEFPWKQKLITNAEDRERIIRAKEP